MSDALQLDEDNEFEQDTEKLQGNLEEAAGALKRRDALGTSNALLKYVESVKSSIAARAKFKSSDKR